MELCHRTPLTNICSSYYFARPKLDSSGRILWLKSPGAVLNASRRQAGGIGISVDQAGGNVYVLGDGQFGATSDTHASTNVSVGAFLAKLDKNGGSLWVIDIGQNWQTSGRALASGADGSIYVTGDFGGTMVFPGQSIEARHGGIFVAKYRNTGDFEWVAQTGPDPMSGPSDEIDSITLGSDGTCYIAGLSGVSAFFEKYSSGGSQLWRQKIGGNYYGAARGIGLDASQNCYVAGFFRGRADFGSEIVNSYGLGDVFLAKRPAALLPTILTGPINQTVVAGSMVKFVANVSSASPSITEKIRMSWQRNGVLVGGASNSTLTLTNVRASDAGAFTVTVSNADGSVTSAPATLTVLHSLVVNTNGNGKVLREPNTPTFLPGASVLLTPVPAKGFGFLGWLSDAAGNGNPLVISMDTNKTVTARFVSTELRTSVEGVGTLSSEPSKPFYEMAENVALTATAGRWHQFARWTDSILSNPRVITIGASNIYRAVFTPTQTLETVSIGGTSRLAPVGMPAITVNGQFVLNNPVTHWTSAWIALQTKFANGTMLYTLDGSQPSFASTLYTNAFTITNSATIRAIAYSSDFSTAVEADPVLVTILTTFKLTQSSPGGGSVSLVPSGGSYVSNSIVRVRALPSAGWKFMRWVGDIGQAAQTITSVEVTMDRAKSIQAVFGTGLSTTIDGKGSILLSPKQSLYPYGSTVRLEPVPEAGYYFALWGNAASGNTTPLDVRVTKANQTISALFAPLPENQVALAALSRGDGRVLVNPVSVLFAKGDTVTLTAKPGTNQTFVGWSGDVIGLQNPLTLAMDQSKIVTANFHANESAPNFSPLTHSSAEGFAFLLSGIPGTSYEVQASSNLSDWVPIAVLTNISGPVRYTDTMGRNQPLRFYRAVSP